MDLAAPDIVTELASAVRAEGVPSALAAARDSVDTVLRDRGHRQTTPHDTAEALLRGGLASARLEGSTTTRADLEAETSDPVAAGAVALAAQLLSMRDVIVGAPMQALARMHSIAARGSVTDDDLGRPRPGGASVIQRVVRLLQDSADLPAIAVAATVHAEIATARPFAAGNGVVARALERLVLVSRGVDPASVTVPEAGYVDLGDGYRQALETYAGHGEAGRQRWLLAATDAIVAGVAHSPLVGSP